MTDAIDGKFRPDAIRLRRQNGADRANPAGSPESSTGGDRITLSEPGAARQARSAPAASPQTPRSPAEAMEKAQHLRQQMQNQPEQAAQAHGGAQPPLPGTGGY